jgi:hypothetical protein
MLSALMMSATFFNDIMLSFLMPNVIMLSVVILSVVALAPSRKLIRTPSSQAQNYSFESNLWFGAITINLMTISRMTASKSLCPSWQLQGVHL